MKLEYFLNAYRIKMHILKLQKEYLLSTVLSVLLVM